MFKKVKKWSFDSYFREVFTFGKFFFT